MAMFLRPWDEINYYLDWAFTPPGLFDPATYDIDVYQKLSDYGNPVLMIIR